MTRDDIIRLAREAGLLDHGILRGATDDSARVERFAALVAAAEREACAKACEDYSADRWAAYKGQPPYEPMNSYRGNPHAQGQSSGAEDCADAIRARGDK